KLGTALALEPASAAARAGADTGFSATLTSGSAGLAQRTVAFVLTPASGPSITQGRITGLGGKGSPRIGAELPPGRYRVPALFADGAPITLPADPVYESASSGTSQLLVDATPPTITFNGNRGTYSVLDQVNITCTATDGGSGSGLQANPCSTFSIN